MFVCTAACLSAATVKPRDECRRWPLSCGNAALVLRTASYFSQKRLGFLQKDTKAELSTFSPSMFRTDTEAAEKRFQGRPPNPGFVPVFPPFSKNIYTTNNLHDAGISICCCCCCCCRRRRRRRCYSCSAADVRFCFSCLVYAYYCCLGRKSHKLPPSPPLPPLLLTDRHAVLPHENSGQGLLRCQLSLRRRQVQLPPPTAVFSHQKPRYSIHALPQSSRPLKP